MKKNITSIEVVYYTPSIIIEKKPFSPKTKFKEIIDYFNLNIKPNNNNLKLKEKYNYKQTKINESINIEQLIDIKANSTNYIPSIFIELVDSNDTNWSRNYILKPKNNPFGIISFSVKTNSISSENFPNNMIQLNNLDRYQPEFSSYCNSYDSLYISGGSERNKQPIDDFWEIDLNNISDKNKTENKYQIKHIKMPSNKKQHSMLYNEKDNSVIIIGGNDKKCMLYSIRTGTFSQLPEMNDVHISPSLLIHNNYLYAFGSFDRKINYFEKLNLTKKEKWEKLFPKDYSLYNNRNFGVCQSTQDDKIIILGGERIGYYTILYDFRNNSLLKSKGKDQTSKLNDKTFYKINNIHCANISDTKENSLIVVNTSTNDVKKVIFDRSGKTDFNFGNNKESDISIKPILEDKKVSKDINSKNLKNLNHRNDENINSKSYNNNFNNNIPDKITLRSSNKKRNLKTIEKFSENDNVNVNNKNANNNDIVINNEINIDDGLQNFEIKIEQEAKENEIDKEKNMLIKGQKHPKFLISTPSLDDQFTNILVQKENKNEEEKVQDENRNENSENILLKSDDKFKSPTKFKLNQSFGIDNYSNYRNNSNNRSTSNKNKLARSMYLNLDDDVKYYSNYDFDNHLFRRMAPHYKKENRLNSSSIFDLRIKNPIVKSKKVKRRKINGHNYSVILEKIIDKDNLSLYENLNMNDSYTYKNDYDNHKFYLSQYLKNEDDEKDILNQRNLTQQPGHKYKTLYDTQIFNKVDIRKKPSNKVKTNRNNNRKYEIKKILINNNYEDEKINENENELKINNLNNNNNYYQKNEPNFSEERKILKSINNYSISPFDNNMQIITKSKNVFEPFKSTTSDKKNEKINDMNDKNNNINEVYPDKNDDQIFDIGNKYIENESVNTNNFEDNNYNDKNIAPIIKRVDYNNNKNKLPLLINSNYNRSSKTKNNNKVIKTYGNAPKEDNIQDNSDRLKSYNIVPEKMKIEKKREYIIKTSENDNEFESQPYNNFVIYESSNKKKKNNEIENQYNNEIQNYNDDKDKENNNNEYQREEINEIKNNENEIQYNNEMQNNNDNKDIDKENNNNEYQREEINEIKNNENEIQYNNEIQNFDDNKDNDKEINNNEYQREEINEVNNKENEKEDEENKNNYNQNINNDFVNDFNGENSGFNNKSNDVNKTQTEKENENESQINNLSNNKSIDFNNYKEQEPENVKIIRNIDNNIRPEERSENNIKIDSSDINYYKPEKKEIKINLDKIQKASKEVMDDEYSNAKINISENMLENNHNYNNGNINMSNKDNANSYDNFEGKENNNNSGAILGNGPATINTKMILNNTKEQISQDSVLNNITKTEIYQKENEDYNLIDANNNQPLGINNEELINAIKKKITKLINVKNGEYSIDDNNADNNNIIDINNNPIIELESSFREKEEEPSYKVRNKKVSEVQFYLPKYSLEEQIFRREVVLNEKENENEIKINDTNEKKDEVNNEGKHQEINKNIYEEENQNKSIENNKSINDENKNEENNINNIENDNKINNRENENNNDDMINNKENEYIESKDMVNNKENQYFENNNNKDNKEIQIIVNDENNNNNEENENKYDNLENKQNIDNNNINENMNNDENISIANNLIVNKNQNGNNLRDKLFKNNENPKIGINRKKKKIIIKDEKELSNNNDMMNQKEKIEIDFDKEQNKDIFFNDKLENEETSNNNENKEEKFFLEKEVINLVSEPIFEIDTRQKIKKPKINFIVDESNIMNQITSIVIIKEEDNNKNESKNEKENENGNKENINNDKNDNDNDNIDNKNIVFKENIKDDKFEQSNNSLEEIDLIANHPAKKKINESENSSVEIDIIGNNQINKNEIKNSDFNNPNLLRRKNQINEKDLNNDNENEKKLLKRKNQINENNLEIYDSEIFNENIPNKVNISKVTKLHDHPYLTLFEIMDEPSNKKIDLNFHEIKDIIFTKEDLNQNFDKNIKKLIRNGIPKTFIISEKSKLKSIYTPQKIKTGKKTFMIKKIKMNNNINIDENDKDNFELKNYNTENISLKNNLDKLEENNKINIASLKYKNLNNNLNKKIIYDQDDDNLLCKNITDTNIKNIVKNRYDENDITDNDQNEISESKKIKQNSNYYVNLKSVPNLKSNTDKRSITPLFKKKINISKGMKLNNLGGNKIKKDN